MSEIQVWKIAPMSMVTTSKVERDKWIAAGHEVVEFVSIDRIKQLEQELAEAKAALASQAQHESKAIGYVVWGISNGKHYKHAIKLPEDAPVDGWQSDNCNLGEFWAGNDLVYLSQAPEVCSDGGKCGAGGYCITCPNMPAPEGGE